MGDSKNSDVNGRFKYYNQSGITQTDAVQCVIVKL